MHAILRSNSLRLVILVWFSGWLLMVMPGHKRGIVTLPGAEIEQAQAEASSSCCEPKPSCCDLPTGDCEEPPKPIDPAKHCAICFLKSHMTDPPAVVLYTPYLGELDELAYLIESSILDELTSSTLMRGRAPPA
ncbi:MAG: hypothetical protein AB8C95_13720 [Phycisphaeraceae bacterium]